MRSRERSGRRPGNEAMTCLLNCFSIVYGTCSFAYVCTFCLILCGQMFLHSDDSHVHAFSAHELAQGHPMMSCICLVCEYAHSTCSYDLQLAQARPTMHCIPLVLVVTCSLVGFTLLVLVVVLQSVNLFKHDLGLQNHKFYMYTETSVWVCID